jgi:hypothetical protein
MTSSTALFALPILHDRVHERTAVKLICRVQASERIISFATAKPAFRITKFQAPMPGNRLKSTSGNPACAERSKMTW